MLKKPMCENSSEVLEYIDPTRPVKCYRNLHNKCVSVLQDGLVKCHTVNVLLEDGTFIVNRAGRDKVRATKCKNVHAYVKGMVIDFKEVNAVFSMEWSGAYYNPYTCDTWQDLDTNRPLKGGEVIDLYIDEKNSDVIVRNVSYA